MRLPRLLSLGASALTACLFFATTALCQPPAGPGRGFGGPGGGPPGGPMMMGMGMGGNPIFLLKNAAVQEELKLTKKQIAQAEKLVDSYLEDIQRQMQPPSFDPAKFGEMSAEQRTKMFEEMRAKQEKTTQKLNAKFQPRLAKLVKPDQVKRLKQIGYQSAGTMTLRNDEIIKALSLSKDQQKRIQAAFDAAGEKMREMFASFTPPGGGFGGPGGRPNGNAPGFGGNPPQPNGDAKQPGGGPRAPGGDVQPQGGPPGGQQFQETFEKMRKLNEDRDSQVLAVLTEEQQKEFDELKGEPFDLAKLRPRGFGPPGQEAGPGQEREPGEKREPGQQRGPGQRSQRQRPGAE